ncbi:MAG TPA: hypothetical protein VHR66_21725 [Gemmataceae bacterium]|jgi:hypothetical protein|nr:hypothetical protein [Gemmataceae bacterium]
MSELAPFLERLFATGEARLAGRPELGERHEVDEVLRHAFADYRLNIAGPLIEIDWETARSTALFTARACWFAVSRDEPPERVQADLPALSLPKTPAAHLSIDFTFRYLVTVYRRIHALNAEDVLAARLAVAFRACPLTGVLTDIADAPTGDLLFGGHAGLELLYAERLAANFRESWLPTTGRVRERVELVFQQMRKKFPVLASGAA